MQNRRQNKEFQKIDGVRVPKEQSFDRESPARSIAKAISWRILASATTFIVLYFSGEGKIALAIITVAVLFDLIAKLALYYVHERIWANIFWGRSWMRYKLIRRIKLNYIRYKRKRRKNFK